MFFNFVDNMKKESKDISDRHISQIVRRKMLQKVKPCGKIYNRQKLKNKH